MSIFTKVVTGIFGKKSEKDLKILSPFVDEINSVYHPLSSLSDDELISQFHSIQKELQDPMSLLLLEGKIKDGDEILVSSDSKKLLIGRKSK